MLAQRLRNIFVKKYVSKLQKLIPQHFVSEKQMEGLIKGSTSTYKSYIFEVRYKTLFQIIFEDFIPSDGSEVFTRVCISRFAEWFIKGSSMSPDDWRRFYSRLNLMVSCLLATVVADSLKLSVSRNVVYTNNHQKATIKFTTSKIFVICEDRDSGAREVAIEVTDDGDTVEKIKKTIILAFGL